jgi:hypothetical protein
MGFNSAFKGLKLCLCCCFFVETSFTETNTACVGLAHQNISIPYFPWVGAQVAVNCRYSGYKV